MAVVVPCEKSTFGCGSSDGLRRKRVCRRAHVRNRRDHEDIAAWAYGKRNCVCYTFFWRRTWKYCVCERYFFLLFYFFPPHYAIIRLLYPTPTRCCVVCALRNDDDLPVHCTDPWRPVVHLEYTRPGRNKFTATSLPPTVHQLVTILFTTSDLPSLPSIN